MLISHAQAEHFALLVKDEIETFCNGNIMDYAEFLKELSTNNNKMDEKIEAELDRVLTMIKENQNEEVGENDK